MADSTKPEAQLAFIAAGLVLLALPLLVVAGAAALALALRMTGTGDVLGGDAGWLVWSLFAAWVVLVVVAVLLFAVRLVRRRLRS
jgi:hypothetical protein